MPAAVRAHNALRWRLAPRRGARAARPRSFPYFFPLDALVQWNRAYGPDGFLQYQFVIPVGHEAELRECFELLRGLHRLPCGLQALR